MRKYAIFVVCCKFSLKIRIELCDPVTRGTVFEITHEYDNLPLLFREIELVLNKSHRSLYSVVLSTLLIDLCTLQRNARDKHLGSFRNSAQVLNQLVIFYKIRGELRK